MADTDKHTYLEVNGDFKMRELDNNDLEQFNALLQYAFQVTSYELFQTGWEQDEIKSAKRPILEKAYVLGWFYKEKLASMIVVYRMQVNIQDEIMSMGGITGVTTYPEYSGRGLIHSLMRYVIDYMHREKMPISFLYPYSIPFYRKLGWEIVSDKLTFTVKDTQLPKAFPVRGMVERVSADSEDFHNVHSYFALQHHGSLIRDELAWDEYWRWENDDMIVAVYYNEDHKPLGYVVYYIANEIFHIKEMIYLNREAQLGLWEYIHAHDSMIDEVRGNNYYSEPIAFELDDSDIKETIRPYAMGRIIDVAQFISQYNCDPDGPGGCFSFEIADDLLPWNNGTFVIDFEKGHCALTDKNPQYHLSMSIGTFTTLLLGYKSAEKLLQMGKIQTTYDAVAKLDDILYHEIPYVSDYI